MQEKKVKLHDKYNVNPLLKKNKMEKEFNETESLALIREMIENAKARLGESSFFFLLWGWLVLIASLLHFILLFTGFQYPYLPWPVVLRKHQGSTKQ